MEKAKIKRASEKVNKVRERDFVDVSLEAMRWGMVLPNTNDLVINARLEDITNRPFFRGLLEKKRCILTCQGYFEWKLDSKSGQKIPYLFTSKQAKAEQKSHFKVACLFNDPIPSKLIQNSAKPLPDEESKI